MAENTKISKKLQDQRLKVNAHINQWICVNWSRSSIIFHIVEMTPNYDLFLPLLLGTQEQTKKVLTHLERIITKKALLLSEESQKRKLPKWVCIFCNCIPCTNEPETEKYSGFIAFPRLHQFASWKCLLILLIFGLGVGMSVCEHVEMNLIKI
jgi:hypothetical protein